MKEVDRNLYYKKLAQVSVNNMIMSNTSKCCKCEDKLQKFTVFVGEGQRLSTMYSSCCDDCLSIVVQEAIEQGSKDAENAIKATERRLYKESLDLIRKIKLKELKNEKSN